MKLSKGNDRYPILLLPSTLSDYLRSREGAIPFYPPPAPPRTVVSPVLYLSLALFIILFPVLMVGRWNGVNIFLLLSAVLGAVYGIVGSRAYYRFLYGRSFGDYRAARERWENATFLSYRYRYHRRSGMTGELAALLRGRVLLPSGASKATRGTSEGYFFHRARAVFGAALSWGGEFPIPGSGLFYSHDLTLHEPMTGLRVDVEIDEPYEGRSKQPHHCLDDGRDARRDEFFLDGNWVVVRFAEEQVVLYPDACVYYLTRVVRSLTGTDSYRTSPLYLPPVPRWTREGARRMAAERFREIYLEAAGLWR